MTKTYAIVCIALVLSLITIIRISADDQKKSECPFENIEKLLCNNKQLTDDIVGKILTNCPFDMQTQADKIIKECAKKQTLTDRERLTAWCNADIQECFNTKFMATADKSVKALEEMTKKAKDSVACIKKQLGIVD